MTDEVNILIRIHLDGSPHRTNLCHLRAQGLWFLLFVVHHLGRQHDHRDDEADPGADEDAAQGVESYALTVVQDGTLSSQ